MTFIEKLSETQRVSAVQFAVEVDDGEAEALAVAKDRGVLLITDDTAAIRLARMLNIPFETTLDLLHAWSKDRAADEVRTVLAAVRHRASFAPPRSHPLRSWFLGAINP